MQATQPADRALLHQNLQQQQQLQPPMAPTASLEPFDPSTCQSLYIGNLHPFVTEPLLHDTFSVIGPIIEVKIIKDKATGAGSGFGFVKYLDHRYNAYFARCLPLSCCDLHTQHIQHSRLSKCHGNSHMHSPQFYWGGFKVSEIEWTSKQH